MKRRPVIYIGYDVRDHRAYEVLEHSIRKYNTKYDIIPLLEPELRRIGLYRRASRVFEHEPKQRYDVFDNRPFSTDFTFTRFLVPALNQYQGIALFMASELTLLFSASSTSMSHPKGLRWTGLHKPDIIEKTGLALCCLTAPIQATKN